MTHDICGMTHHFTNLKNDKWRKENDDFMKLSILIMDVF